MFAPGNTAPRNDAVKLGIASTSKAKEMMHLASTADSVSDKSTFGTGISNKSSQISTKCAVCRQHTKFTCAECKDTYYCSRVCRASDYSLHRKVCTRVYKPYDFKVLSRVYQKRIFKVEEFQRGPDQPSNPPDTEEYDDVQILWR